MWPARASHLGHPTVPPSTPAAAAAANPPSAHRWRPRTSATTGGSARDREAPEAPRCHASPSAAARAPMQLQAAPPIRKAAVPAAATATASPTDGPAARTPAAPPAVATAGRTPRRPTARRSG
ncbi:hypothetical protein CEJ63_26560, partial [Acinetobacter baumannii]